MNTTAAQPQIIHYLPVLTTFLSVVFFTVLFRRYRSKGRGAHLLWWAGGVLCYGLGTAAEAAVTLWGNSPGLNKTWYIVGALFGGYPLAQGTVYLLLRRRTANILTSATVPIIVILAVLVILGPTNTGAIEPHRPGGAALGWQWIRWFTPIINLYAAVFLIGGAALSGWRFAKRRATGHRAVGNALIALGALLPGIGGGMAKAGIVEGLYVGELAGLILIWIGYTRCVRRPALQPAAAAPAEAAAVPAP
ncbi:MAG: hypothetical protein ACE5F9_01360 [Phycisphaerae bacterium]